MEKAYYCRGCKAMVTDIITDTAAAGTEEETDYPACAVCLFPIIETYLSKQDKADIRHELEYWATAEDEACDVCGQVAFNKECDKCVKLALLNFASVRARVKHLASLGVEVLDKLEEADGNP